MNPNSDRSTTSLADQPTQSSEELRALAVWYRNYAELAGSTVIWDYRLSTAEHLERQASDMERQENRALGDQGQ
jgi:hypothetical protein